MHTLYALVLTAAAAVVIAHPLGPVTTGPQTPSKKYMEDHLIPEYLWQRFYSYEKTPHDEILQKHRLVTSDWLNRKIQHAPVMNKFGNTYKSDRMMAPDTSNIKRYMAKPTPFDLRSHIKPYPPQRQPFLPPHMILKYGLQQASEMKERVPVTEPTRDEKKKGFALTPLDDGYFTTTEIENPSAHMTMESLHEGGGDPEPPSITMDPEREPEPPRTIRQNPNLSRTKTLVAEDLDKLKIGFDHGDTEPTDKSGHILVPETESTDSSGSFYGVALLSAFGAAAVLAFVGFTIGWYTLSKRAKAAAEVDYPAYGVTGPTVDSSGDRKLAHSAHMYHYQHQKQQIIAMERNGMEQRDGSVSDPESDDENEEGDYTVYECPGFATTGEMEVKNPLFTDDPTPATPGKCEVVKPQPKD